MVFDVVRATLALAARFAGSSPDDAATLRALVAEQQAALELVMFQEQSIAMTALTRGVRRARFTRA